MKVSFLGISEQVITFYDAGAEKGKVCKVSASGTVKKCVSGERFMGVCVNADGSYADVQTEGCVTVAYSGTAPAVGFNTLASDSGGNVSAVSSGGGEYLILEVDTSAKTCTLYL